MTQLPVPRQLPSRIWVNDGGMPKWLDVVKVIEHYTARSGGAVRYVGELALLKPYEGVRRTLQKPLRWTEVPYAVFWQERPPAEYSPYFGLNMSGSDVMISDGSSVDGLIWSGGMHPETGEVVFSRYRHDARGPEDGSFMVDGGQDYMRCSGRFIPTSVKLDSGQWVIHEMANTIENTPL